MSDNLELFDFPKFKITQKIRLIELFGGIGSQAIALRDIGADFEHYRLVEFDKYAIASYNSIHGTHFEPSDIKNIHGVDLGITKKDKYCYLLTYSFPCQDLSVAGKHKGMKKGDNTRSGLLWEVERILNELNQEDLPQVLLMENVPQVHAEANMLDYEAWLSFLRSKGYHNFWKDLNAKDYGIPQNRDRCFCVSVLSESFVDYQFPKSVKLEKVMKDFLEKDVEEKYYINNEKSKKLIEQLVKDGVIGTENIEKTKQDDSVLDCEFYKKAIETAIKENAQLGDIVDAFNGKVRKDGICPTITTRPEGKKTAILPCVKAKTTRGSDIVSTIRSSYYKNGERNIAENVKNVMGYEGVIQNYRIRKLTPRECWRLMGYSDSDFDKAQKVNSNTQLYRQAGNAIVKQVLMAIFKQMGA